MNQSIFKILSCGAIAATIISCESENLISEVQQSSQAESTENLNSLSDKSILPSNTAKSVINQQQFEYEIKKAAKVEHLIGADGNASDGYSTSASGLYGFQNYTTNNKTIKHYLTVENIKQIGLSDYEWKDAGKIYDPHYVATSPWTVPVKFDYRHPDGVTINDYRTSGAYRGFNTAHKYNAHAYIVSHLPKVEKVGINKKEYQKYTFTLTNPGDRAATMTQRYDIAIGHTITETVLESHGIKINQEINIPIKLFGATTIGYEFNHISGTSEALSTVRTFSSSATKEVPANSKVTVTVYVVHKIEHALATIPLELSGYIVSNFDSNYLGHYFHFIDASKIIKIRDQKVRYDSDYLGDVVITFSLPEKL